MSLIRVYSHRVAHTTPLATGWYNTEWGKVHDPAPGATSVPHRCSATRRALPEQTRI